VENASNEYIDDLILSQAGHRQLKVAMLHVRVLENAKPKGELLATKNSTSGFDT
jgi:hypothetical protein